MFVRGYPLLKGDGRDVYVNYQGNTGVRDLFNGKCFYTSKRRHGPQQGCYRITFFLQL